VTPDAAAKVQKLEQLLERIGRNRVVARAAAGGAPTVEHPVREVAARERRPSPLQQAVAQSARPAAATLKGTAPAAPTPPAQTFSRPAPDAPPKRAPARSAKPAAPAASPPPAEQPTAIHPAGSAPTAIAPGRSLPPSEPIVKITGGDVVSTSPATFGELLSRTLSLKPR
jgi:hypothetical protein